MKQVNKSGQSEHVDFTGDFYSYANPLSRLAEHCWRGGVCTSRTLKRSHFLYLLLCRLGFPANQNLENRITQGYDASGQESLSNSHPIWPKPFLFNINFEGFCLFCLGFIFVDLCCSQKVIIFAAEQLKLENFGFQLLVIVLGKKCRKAAKMSCSFESFFCFCVCLAVFVCTIFGSASPQFLQCTRF